MTRAIVDVLADFAVETRYRDIPGSALNAAKRSLLDTMIVAMGARDTVGGREAIDLALEEGAKPTSSIWVSDKKISARSATFVNSLLASALDFDSLHPEAVVHSDIVIIPTALAVAEAQGASGQDLLTAIVVGSEILCRLGCSTRINSGWFYTSLYGTIAGAAAAARLLGGNTSQVAGAMGLGFLNSSGTQQPAVERSISKRMQGAFAASNGVAAGYLGVRNLSGPREFVEGRFGLFRMYENGDCGAITQDLGKRFEIEKITYKLYPSCQCNHAAIEGMLQLKQEYGLAPDEIESVEVFVSPYMQRLVGSQFCPGVNPQVAAQFSIQYSIAAVLLFGRLSVIEIQDTAILDPRVNDIVTRVVVKVDPGNRNNYAPVRLKIIRKHGSVIEREITSFRGNSDMALSNADLKEKLALCLEAGRVEATTTQIETFFEALMNIEQCPNMALAVPHILSLVLRQGFYLNHNNHKEYRT